MRQQVLITEQQYTDFLKWMEEFNARWMTEHNMQPANPLADALQPTAATGVRPPGLAPSRLAATLPSRAPQPSPVPFGAQGGYGRRRSPLEEALRRLQGGM